MEPAFVLHRWPYQDSSLLVELLSAEQGRFRVIAKGAKRPKSRWRSILQPFTPLQIVSRGRGDLQTLIAAEASDCGIALQGHALYSGFYVNELVQRLTTPHQAIEQLFEHYHETLLLLAATAHVEPVLRRFEWHLLCHLGHGFDWSYDSEQHAIEPQYHYRFTPELGFTRVRQDTQNVPFFVGADILQLAAFEQLDQRLLNLLKRIMRTALQPYLGEQPLRSRELFVQFKDKS